MQSIIRFSRLALVLAAVLLAAPAIAAVPSDSLLPRATVGYVSVAQPEEFDERWRQTQLGQMLDDPVMQPFVEDFRAQLQDEFRAFEDKLGITWEDLEGVPAGELSLAVIERPGTEAALAITIDVTGREREADDLLAAVETRFAARGGRMQTAEVAGTTLRVFTVPTQPGSPPQVTVYFVRDDTLVGIDDRREAEAILRRFDGEPRDNLRSVAAYRAVMARAREEAQDLRPEARWFVEPFAFLFALRTLEETDTRRNGPDYVKILSEQGFDAIRGAGGFFNQLVDEQVDLLFRTAAYAPPVPGRERDPLRWNLSMRMLQLPNVPGFEPQSWVPRMSASYSTLQLRLDHAFDNVGPLFDAIQEHKGAWENTLWGWEHDPYGQQVNVRREFIDNMGERITMVMDYDTPVSVNSERSLFAIEALDEAALAAALEKWMRREPDRVRREIGQFVVWEQVPRHQLVEKPRVELPTVFRQITPGPEKREEEEREPLIPNSAVTVAMGQMMMASDIQYLEEILHGFGQHERLEASADYQQVLEVMSSLAPGDRSGWSFGRTDEEVRPTFELLRRGKMPEAETMFGRLLNSLLTTKRERDDGVVREQRIDGSTLPSFEAVRRYFGPRGVVLRSDADGWFITGAILQKEAPPTDRLQAGS